LAWKGSNLPFQNALGFLPEDGRLIHFNTGADGQTGFVASATG